MRTILLLFVIVLIFFSCTPRTVYYPNGYPTNCVDAKSRTVERDEPYYNFYFTFLSGLVPNIGRADLSEITDYCVDNVRLGQPIDSVFSHLGPPECSSTYQGVHGEKVKILYYDGRRFAFVSYSGEPFSLGSIMTYKAGATRAENIRCNMTLDEIKPFLTNFTLKLDQGCAVTGILSVQRAKTSDFLKLLFLDNRLFVIVLEDGNQ